MIPRTPRFDIWFLWEHIYIFGIITLQNDQKVEANIPMYVTDPWCFIFRCHVTNIILGEVDGIAFIYDREKGSVLIIGLFVKYPNGLYSDRRVPLIWIEPRGVFLINYTPDS